MKQRNLKDSQILFLSFGAFFFMIDRYIMHYRSILLMTLLASSNILAAIIPAGISVREDIPQKPTEERNLAISSRSSSEEKKRTDHGPEKTEERAAAAVNTTLQSGISPAPGQRTSSQTQEERSSAVGNRFDPNFHPGRILENFRDALDVNGPWYVGLGTVVESLNALQNPD